MRVSEILPSVEHRGHGIFTVCGAVAGALVAAVAATSGTLNPTSIALFSGAAIGQVSTGYFVNQIKPGAPPPETQQNHDLARCLRLMVSKRLEASKLERGRFKKFWPDPRVYPARFPTSIKADPGPILANLIGGIAVVHESGTNDDLPVISFGKKEEWAEFLREVAPDQVDRAQEFSDYSLWWFLFEVRHDPVASQALMQYLHALTLQRLDQLRLENIQQGEELTEAIRTLQEFSDRHVRNHEEIMAGLSDVAGLVSGVASVREAISDSSLPDRQRALDQPRWADIAAGYVIDRTLAGEILQRIRGHEEGLLVLRVVGVPGAGKWTLLRRIAAILVQNDGIERVFYGHNPGNILLHSLRSEKTILFINAGQGSERLNDQLKVIDNPNLILIIAEENVVEKGSLDVFSLSPKLDEFETRRLASLLDLYDSGSAEPSTRPRDLSRWLDFRIPRKDTFEPMPNMVVERPQAMARDAGNRLLFAAPETSQWSEPAAMSRLRRFLTQDGSFGWWVVTGPGGVGKSRLAFELCREAQGEGWDAGFVQKGFKPDLDSDECLWNPVRDTLLIVDNLLSTPKGEKKALQWAVNLPKIASAANEVKTRIIFLDRPQEEDLWETAFKDAESVSGLFGGVGCQAHWQSSGDVQERSPGRIFETLNLEGMRAENIVRLMRLSAEARERSGRTCQSLQGIDWDMVAADYAKIDPVGLPLFAMMAGEIVAAKGSITQMNLEGIGAYKLQEYLDDWRADGVDEAHLRLLLLATIMDGIDLREPVERHNPILSELRDWLPSKPDINQCDIMASATMRKAGFLSRLSPDPLGELFALKFLQGDFLDHTRGVYGGDEGPQQILHTASLQDPEAVMEFSNRTLRDYGFRAKAFRRTTVLDVPADVEVEADDIQACEELRRLRAPHPRWSKSGWPAKLRRIEWLDFGGCANLKSLPNLAPLTSLERLDLWECSGLVHLPSLSVLPNLKRLDLWGCVSLRDEKSPALANIGALEWLDLRGCTGLTQLEELETLCSLRRLHLRECTSLRALPDLSTLRALEHLDLWNCTGLTNLPEFLGLHHLEKLHLRGCTGLVGLPGLSDLGVLYWLNLGQCSNLENLPDLSPLHSLQRLDLWDCSSLEVLPDLAGLKNLEILDLRGCDKLTQIPDLSGLTSLRRIDIGKAELLEGRKNELRSAKARLWEGGKFVRMI